MSNEWNKMNCTKELRNTKKFIPALDAIVTKINQTKEKKKTLDKRNTRKPM